MKGQRSRCYSSPVCPQLASSLHAANLAKARLGCGWPACHCEGWEYSMGWGVIGVQVPTRIQSLPLTSPLSFTALYAVGAMGAMLLYPRFSHYIPYKQKPRHFFFSSEAMKLEINSTTKGSESLQLIPLGLHVYTVTYFQQCKARSNLVTVQTKLHLQNILYIPN